jgi:hypothetical protein
MRCFALTILIACLAGSVCTTASAAGTAEPRMAELTPLAATVQDAPRAVRASDRRFHLVYEISLLNTSTSAVRLDRVVVRGGGKVRATYEGPGAIGPIMSDVSHPFDPIDSLEPSAGGTLWMDVAFNRRSQIPARLKHRLVTTPLTSGEPSGPSTATVGARTRVIRSKPVVITPPLSGPGYVDANGCCGLGAHVRALFTFDGRRYLSQRFAIDWVRLDESGRWWSGDPSKNRDFEVFGDRIIAAAPGKVVSTRDDLPQNTPPSPLGELDLGNALGNQVKVRMRGGLFAIYAHMRSVAVEAGDRVRRGQLLGRVGNSGGSTAPHLHFQINPSLRGGGALSSGVPYVFDEFDLQGRIANFEDFLSQVNSVPAIIDPPKRPVHHSLELPMQADVVDFPDR